MMRDRRKTIVEKEWTIKSDFGEEKHIVEAIIDTVDSCGITEPRLDDMLTSVSEACLNALEHGNRLNRNLDVKVNMFIFDNRYVYRIYDQGSGFDASAHAPNQVHGVGKNMLTNDDPRGWGLFLIQSLSDGVVTGTDGRGAFFTEIRFNRTIN